MGRARLVLALATAAFAQGCGGGYTVTRVVDGRAQEGRFIEPDAYAAYLRGALAEAHGEYRTALAEYENAAKLDDEDPEIWTRIADVRCKIDPKDLEAQYAVTRALLRDEEYGPAWVVRASCEIARGVDRVHVEQAAARAVEVDPRSTKAQVLLARVEDGRAPVDARRRLVALTIAQGNDADAWMALGSWAEGEGDATLEATAFSRAAGLTPTRWKIVADAAARLAGNGALREARELSAALADAEHRLRRADAREPFAIDQAPLVARMAVDEALARGDADVAERRASLGRIDVDELAARATLLGKESLGRDLLAPVTKAEPTRPVRTFPFDAPIPGDTLVSDAAARRVVAGELDATKLSSEAAMEVAVRTGQVPKTDEKADARHRLLACAFASDAEEIPAACTALATHVRPFAGNDALVAVALAKLELRSGHVERDAAERIVALAPTDPLVERIAAEIRKRPPRTFARPIDFSDDPIQGELVTPSSKTTR